MWGAAGSRPPPTITDVTDTDLETHTKRDGANLPQSETKKRQKTESVPFFTEIPSPGGGATITEEKVPPPAQRVPDDLWTDQSYVTGKPSINIPEYTIPSPPILNMPTLPSPIQNGEPTLPSDLLNSS
mmetsp:Transcript_7925/g.15495  ORF Transcript_7925/g.15495 Transcript_7925/m.15495 type:complete len:128 (+) Transcript_7925:383-766(+)